MSHSTLVRALALGATLAAASACHKREAAARVAEVEGQAAIPASATAVVGIDVGKLGRSSVVQRAVEQMLLGDPVLAKAISDLTTACKIDPLHDLRSILLGMDGDGSTTDRVVMVVSGKLGEGDLAACVTKAVAGAGGKLSSSQVGGRTHYHVDLPEGRSDLWFAFGGKDTVVVSSSADYLAEALGDGKKLADSGELAGWVVRAQPRAALWFAGRVPATVGQGLAKVAGGKLGAPLAMFGHLDLAQGVGLELGVEMASADQAKEAVSLGKSQLDTLALVAQARGPALGRLVHRIELVADDHTVFLRAQLSEAELAEVLAAPVDSGGGTLQNPAPSKGVPDHGQGDAPAGDEAPVR